LGQAFHRELAVFKQSLIPGFPVGAQRIGESLSILERDGQVIYFVGGDNYFCHPQDDLKSRRFVLASLMESGHVRAVDLQGAPLCIAHRTLMNWVGQYRKDGSVSFFRNAPVAKPSVMSAQVSAQCAALLADGLRPSVVARRVGIQESTLRKAIKRQAVAVLPECGDAHAQQGAGSTGRTEPLSTKAERSRDDALAADAMGMACTRAVRVPMSGSQRLWDWLSARRLDSSPARTFRWRSDGRAADGAARLVCQRTAQRTGPTSQACAGLLQRLAHPAGLGLHGSGSDPSA
jgi:transposase-like protein